jgi:hypothetical protein
MAPESLLTGDPEVRQSFAFCSRKGSRPKLRVRAA